MILVKKTSRSRFLIGALSLIVSLAFFFDAAVSSANAHAAEKQGALCASYASKSSSLDSGLPVGVSVGCAGDAGAPFRALAHSDDDLVMVITIGSPYAERAQPTISSVVDRVHADQAAGKTLGESFTARAQEGSVGFHPPGEGDLVFDGQLHAVGTGNLLVVIPGGEIGTAANWWQKWIASGLGVAVWLAVSAVCLAAFNVGAPAAGPVCGAVGNAFGALFGELLNAYFDGRSLGSGDVWAEALAVTMWGAVVGAFGGQLLEWASTSSGSVISSFQTTLRGWATHFKFWKSPLEYISDTIGGISQWLLESLKRNSRGIGSTSSPIRVMPGGDSITAGYGSFDQNGYRLTAYTDLTGGDADGKSSVDFVGSQRSGNMQDPDHEGHSGWRIAEIGQALHDSVPRHQPNVVMLMAGTNDMNSNYEVATAPDRLAAVIDQIFHDSPASAVVVSSLVPASSPATQARINTFNTQIRERVFARQRAGKKVRWADMSKLTTADLGDGLHPNDAGYQKIGHLIAQAAKAAVLVGRVDNPPGNDPQCSNAPGRWLERGEIASGTVASLLEYVQFADINGDGRDDYLVIDAAKGAVRAWMNHGGGPNGNPVWVPAGEIASGTGHDLNREMVQFADLDGDRAADYLVVNQVSGAVRAWMNRGGRPSNPVWVPAGEIASGTGHDAATESVRFADLQGDGRDDYLVLNRTSGAVKAWKNAGPGANGNPVWLPAGQIASGTGHSSSEAVTFANITCDKRADYLVGNGTSGAVKAWWNTGSNADGNPVWDPRGQIASGIPLSGNDSLVFADLNGDGRDDYLVVNRRSGAVKAWYNNGGDPT